MPCAWPRPAPRLTHVWLSVTSLPSRPLGFLCEGTGAPGARDRPSRPQPRGLWGCSGWRARASGLGVGGRAGRDPGPRDLQSWRRPPRARASWLSAKLLAVTAHRHEENGSVTSLQPRPQEASTPGAGSSRSGDPTLLRREGPEEASLATGAELWPWWLPCRPREGAGRRGAAWPGCSH